MSYDWQGRWQRNDITFHLAQVNPLLMQYWPNLNLAKSTHVLVPLCGKSLDMLWLADLGHHVIGVELSPIACEAFFSEHQIKFTCETKNELTLYHSEHIDIFCGDFFKLTKAMLPTIHAVYDRAALVALPQDLQVRYAQQLINLVSVNTAMLLFVNEALNPLIIQGPPYPLSLTDIQNLYARHFDIKELARVQKNSLPEHWYQKGYRDGETFEVVYLLN